MGLDVWGRVFFLQGQKEGVQLHELRSQHRPKEGTLDAA